MEIIFRFLLVINLKIDFYFKLSFIRDSNLKFSAEKTTFSAFTTDRKHRNLLKVKFFTDNKPIKKISCPMYLGITLDAELKFTEHVRKCADS